VLRTPREVRNALAYVLTNDLKHRHGRGRVELGPHSSALLVKDAVWARLLGRRWRRIVGFPVDWEPDEHERVREQVNELLTKPVSWLLREGWLRAHKRVALASIRIESSKNLTKTGF
jgi:hypothetical protein